MKLSGEEETLYSVSAYTQDGFNLGSQFFHGSKAFAQANDHLEALKRIGLAHEVWMTRLDGEAWQFVERLLADDSGVWHSIRDIIETDGSQVAEAPGNP